MFLAEAFPHAELRGDEVEIIESRPRLGAAVEGFQVVLFHLVPAFLLLLAVVVPVVVHLAS